MIGSRARLRAGRREQGGARLFATEREHKAPPRGLTLDQPRKEQAMRSNSGKGDATNNLHDPTLKEKERETGSSGTAIQGEKKVDATPSRTRAR